MESFFHRMKCCFLLLFEAHKIYKFVTSFKIFNFFEQNCSVFSRPLPAFHPFLPPCFGGQFYPPPFAQKTKSLPSLEPEEIQIRQQSA